MIILLMIIAFFVPYLYLRRTRISKWWKEKIWNPMYRYHADKLAHYIGLREFTSFLRRTGLPVWAVLTIAICVSILKELIDWWKGEGIDPYDLLADGLGIIMAFWN